MKKGKKRVRDTNHALFPDFYVWAVESGQLEDGFENKAKKRWRPLFDAYIMGIYDGARMASNLISSNCPKLVEQKLNIVDGTPSPTGLPCKTCGGTRRTGHQRLCPTLYKKRIAK
jgi:hypothetical protein